ncbi:MAG: hypothetical protein KJ989_02900 [Gammaproteobacteria bacterium]|nr:hypothetical protein [Gammaproteobacteria bacterium]MBU2155044.1 hypothetical protein [Gammaproteobacteria bacterium]MBU2255497.1 hypothetical protein [Gammaproteobacteria bacterium]MBU2293134.1 hypothetical protein [Gammaproteobacteria bacterium]
MKKTSLPIHKEASPSHGQNITSPTELLRKAPSKIARILGHLLHTGPLNRFEAERIGDHCLNSTISDLANDHGLTFTRTPEKVPNHWGQPCDVTRYSLPASEYRRALLVLDMLSHKGKKVAA